MTDRELMQQALEALRLAKSSHNMVLSSDPPQSAWRYYDVDMKLQETITALDKRLAQPEQEPVAWANSNDLQNFDMRVRTNGGPLHTVPLYTTPPHRPWVGLTDEELSEVYNNFNWDFKQSWDYERAIEAKLKEKNT